MLPACWRNALQTRITLSVAIAEIALSSRGFRYGISKSTWLRADAIAGICRGVLDEDGGGDGERFISFRDRSERRNLKFII
jgi:hypothetical protein